MSTATKKRIGYLLAYRDPAYVRTQSLLSALKGIDGIELVTIVNSKRGLARYAETLKKLRSYLAENALDLIIIGFRGYELYWPVKWIVGPDTPIILDAMMSPYAALVEENKMGVLGKTAAMAWYPLERSVLRNSSLVFTDTSLHQAYFHETFGIPVEKLIPLPVGAVEDVPNPTAGDASGNRDFSVLFYGSFLPLHGIEFIIQAASIIKHLPIRFDFIGGGARGARRLHKLCRKSGVQNYTHRYWADKESLLSRIIPAASLCLGGPFGNTPQGRRVITGKTSQCLALGKATVIGTIDADYGLINRVNCLMVPQGDPPELANQIAWAYENQQSLTRLGEEGRKAYHKTLSVSVIRGNLENILDDFPR